MLSWGFVMKTLIVDNETTSRKRLKQIMTPLGETMVASDGKSALEIFKKGWSEGLPFDLIFLDVGKGESGGIEALQTIRNIETDKQVPPQKKVKVIVVSENADKTTVMSCVKAGCDDYIVKPADKKRVYDKLKHFGVSVAQV